MSSTGLIILLIAVGFFVVVGLGATSNLIATAKTNTDSTIQTAASGVSGVMSPLWTVFVISILIIGAYALTNAYSTM
jgi:hypothetical protein